MKVDREPSVAIVSQTFSSHPLLRSMRRDLKVASKGGVKRWRLSPVQHLNPCVTASLIEPLCHTDRGGHH